MTHWLPLIDARINRKRRASSLAVFETGLGIQLPARHRDVVFALPRLDQFVLSTTFAGFLSAHMPTSDSDQSNYSAH